MNPYYEIYLKYTNLTLECSKGWQYMRWIEKRHREFNGHGGVARSFHSQCEGYKEEFIGFLEDFCNK